VARVAVIVATFTVVVVVALGGLLAGFRSEALTKEALVQHEARTYLARYLGTPRASADVLWLGDSTIQPAGDDPGYPALAQMRALEAVGLRSEIVTVAGLDFYGSYALLGKLLPETRPRVVVMIANLRFLGSKGANGSFNDLIRFVPASELPRLLLSLPYGMRGMTALGVLLAPALRNPALLDALIVLQDVQKASVGSRWSSVLEPSDPPGSEPVYVRLALEHLREYARVLTAQQPLVRFATAAVEVATRHGARVLVVVTPIPIEVAREAGVYDEQRIGANVAVLREAVASGGGRLVDLHGLLEPGGFRDRGGHFTRTGSERMAASSVAELAVELRDPRLARAAVERFRSASAGPTAIAP
jgi:hypothetical protein